MESKLSTKGQLIIPLEVRERHRWRPGTALLIEDHGTHVVLRAAPELRSTSLRDVTGCAQYEGPRKSLEEMEEGVARRARSRA